MCREVTGIAISWKKIKKMLRGSLLTKCPRNGQVRITYRREFRTFYLVSETQTQGQIVVLDAGVRETV